MIRKALPKDLDAIDAIAQSQIEGKTSSLKEELSDENLSLSVLDENNLIQGYILLRLEGEECEVDEIALLKEFQHQGLGSLLLDHALKEEEQHGVRKFFLEVRRSNTPAIRLYEKFGFVSYRIRRNYYQNEDAICYVREVKR